MGIRTCPRCTEPLQHTHTACPFCSFSLADVDSTFGSKRVRLQRLVDATKTITPEEIDKLDARMDRFEWEFPQLHFATYIAELPDSVNLRELGFWLSNRSMIDSPRGNDSAILLCINSRQLSASLTLGYLPEQHLPEVQLRQILEQAKPYLSARRFAPLIFACLSSISSTLRQHASVT
ncbi:MAG: uncharacterized Zn finger protein (UPF0148 family) [Verrucomicrobiales bacterium]|jgi:uncharacterized Zn finger protein (UPF0148 family)